jgi:two-component system nitrate/nitrite response regulator NarL
MTLEATSCGVESLSPTQRKVLVYIAKGFTDREIGGLLQRSVHTVREHTKAVFKRLDVGSRAEAAVMAAKAGLV